MAEGIQIKNLPSTTAIKQGDTMTIVQDKQNKQLSLDVFANESDLATLSPLENRCDEVKAKIEVDEYSAEITTSQSMSEIGSDDNGANLHENVLDGAYESCVLKGKTKYIDNDTQEILDTFQDGRNLSLIDVKSPVLTTTGKNLFDGKFSKYNTVYGQYHFGNGIYTYSITDNDISVDLSNVSFGDAENGEISINWLVGNGNAYGNKRTITNRNLVFYPNNEETFNKIKQRYNIQIEQGSVATSYEPYKTNVLSFNQKDDKTIVLRSLSDGTCDTLNVETGEYVQKIGERSYQNGDINS